MCSGKIQLWKEHGVERISNYTCVLDIFCARWQTLLCLCFCLFALLCFVTGWTFILLGFLHEYINQHVFCYCSTFSSGSSDWRKRENYRVQGCHLYNDLEPGQRRDCWLRLAAERGSQPTVQGTQHQTGSVMWCQRTFVECLHLIIGGSCHKYYFCRDKSILVVTILLAQQNYFGANKTFVTTIICCDKHNFVMTGLLLS